MIEEALQQVSSKAISGSCIVANDRASCCSYKSLQNLKQYKVISVEQLQKFDPPGESKLLYNLGNYLLLDVIINIVAYLWFSACKLDFA